MSIDLESETYACCCLVPMPPADQTRFVGLWLEDHPENPLSSNEESRLSWLAVS
jgi:hypothetical protein